MLSRDDGCRRDGFVNRTLAILARIVGSIRSESLDEVELQRGKLLDPVKVTISTNDNANKKIEGLGKVADGQDA